MNKEVVKVKNRNEMLVYLESLVVAERFKIDPKKNKIDEMNRVHDYFISVLKDVFRTETDDEQSITLAVDIILMTTKFNFEYISLLELNRVRRNLYNVLNILKRVRE